jgi:hypothetical protein
MGIVEATPRIIEATPGDHLYNPGVVYTTLAVLVEIAVRRPQRFSICRNFDPEPASPRKMPAFLRERRDTG